MKVQDSWLQRRKVKVQGQGSKSMFKVKRTEVKVLGQGSRSKGRRSGFKFNVQGHCSKSKDLGHGFCSMSKLTEGQGARSIRTEVSVQGQFFKVKVKVSVQGQCQGQCSKKLSRSRFKGNVQGHVSCLMFKVINEGSRSRRTEVSIQGQFFKVKVKVSVQG